MGRHHSIEHVHQINTAKNTRASGCFFVTTLEGEVAPLELMCVEQKCLTV